MTRQIHRPLETRIGERYGKLSILAVRRRGTGSSALARCDCGAERWMNGQSIYGGKSISCGCYRRANASRMNPPRHGMTGTKVHNTWIGILRRVTNPNSDSAPHYLNRGISVCDRWKLFENFYADMGECPPEMTIERIDNDGDYEPKNCRWATIAEQALNKTNTRMLELDGERLPLCVWALRSGVKRATIDNRLKRGLDVKAAIFQPARIYTRK